MSTTAPHASLEDLPIVEPLSEATGEALKPLELRQHDYLVVTTDDGERTRFVLKADTFRTITEEERIRIDEDEDDHTDILFTADGVPVIRVGRSLSYQCTKFFDRIPERTHLGQQDYRRYGEYSAAATDFTALMIHSCWPRGRIIFKGEEAELLYTFLLRRFLSQNIRAKLQAQFKINGVVPKAPPDFRDHAKNPLAEYQRVALQMALGQEAMALFMEQGTGKTPVTIARVCLEAQRTREGKMGGTPRMMRVLVVVPNQVRLNWQNEFQKFAVVSGKVTVIRGGKIRRVRLLTYAMKSEDRFAFTAVIIGYDTFKNDVDIFTRIKWDLVVADESHMFKATYKTMRGAAMRDIRGVASRRMVLTGTPIANTILDIFEQFEFLGEGLSGFSTAKAFRSFHAMVEKRSVNGVGNSIDIVRGACNVPLMQERLARLSFSITKKDAGLNLPDKVHDVIEIEMTTRQSDFYRQMLASVVKEVEKELAAAASGEQNKMMTAQHILTQLLRLSQITSGFAKWDAEVEINSATEEIKITREARVEQIDPGKNPKVLALVELLQDPQKDPNEKTIVSCNWVEDIRAVREALMLAGIEHVHYYGATTEADREEAIRRFNHDVKCRVLVGNPQCYGTGLNLLGYNYDDPEDQWLPSYCGHQIFFSGDWSYLKRCQAEDRSHRRGTRMPPRITDLVVPSGDVTSIDEEMRARVVQKGENADAIRDVTDILNSILNVDVEGMTL